MNRGPRRVSVRLHPLSLGLLCIVLLSPVGLLAFEARPVPGRLLLKLHDWVQTDAFVTKAAEVARTHDVMLDELNERFGVTRLYAQFPGETSLSKATAGYDLSKFYVVDFPAAFALENVRQEYAASPAVEIAEFDWMVPLHLEPNDLGTQWFIESTTGRDAHITGGWNHSTGDSSIVLAIADSGVDWEHPDLGGSAPDFTDGNIWINWAEMNGTPGMDDDSNGLIDDVRGWDFVASLGGAWPGEDATQADNDPRDFNGHGTHVAGIASAITNNGAGVAGVGFNCKIMPMRIGGSIDDGGQEQGVVFMSYAAAAINYARTKGATAINCSWGSSFTTPLATAVNAAIGAGMVVVVSAGNDNSSSPSYLSSRGDCFDVAASTNNDSKASFSNFGTWVDVTAPGVNIRSTYFDPSQAGSSQHTYHFLQGTSMAAPVVTGMVGLVKAHWPTWSNTQIMAQIQAGADPIDELNPMHAGLLGEGRVNALRTFNDFFLTIPNDYPNLAKALSASGDGDTLALVGGSLLTGPLFLTRNQRLIQGGWDATFTSRDPNNHAIVQPLGAVPAAEFVAGIDSSLVLDGLQFSGGRARQIGSPSGKFGGGILCVNASPRLQNCVFENNQAGETFDALERGGAGAFFANSTSRLENCRFENNRAQLGSGLYVLNSNLTLVDCQIINNTVHSNSGSQGVGLYAVGSTISIEGGLFSANSGAADGGGLLLTATTMRAQGTSFMGNSALNSGGNLRLENAIVSLTNCKIGDGLAALGAGVHLTNASVLDVTASFFQNNVAEFIGGAIYADGSGGTLVNVTLDANSGVAGGEALYVSNPTSSWTVRSCVVSNHSSSSALLFAGAPPVPALDYNLYWNNSTDMSGGTMGGNALSADPLYVDAAAGDLELGLHSPALDSGDPDASKDDPDGSPGDRGGSGGPGAERRAPSTPTGLTIVHSAGTNELTWDANLESHVGFYAIYRDPDSSFVASASNYIGSAPVGQNSFNDVAASATSWYVIAAVETAGASSGFSSAVQSTGGSTDTAAGVPARLASRQNEPNPFNPSTRLFFDLPQATHVWLQIYDARGQLVRQLVNRHHEVGFHEVIWDGKDDASRAVGSGVYVYRVVAGDSSVGRKMTLVR